MRIIADESVQIEVLLETPPSHSEPNTELFRTLERVLAETAGSLGTLPLLAPGTTDMRFLRRRGVICYGLSPIFLEPSNLEVHGVDENISVENLTLGTRVIFETLRAFCAAEGNKP